MMKKMWKNRSGVSPVIATILMVAITVVLAAVLYVMVMGFGSNPTNNATGAIGPAQKVSDQKYTIAVTSISQNDISFTDCKANLLVNGSAETAVSLSGTETKLGSSSVYSVKYTDSDGNGKISAGDVIVLTSSSTFTSGSYELKLLGTNGQIASTTFTVA